MERLAASDRSAQLLEQLDEHERESWALKAESARLGVEADRLRVERAKAGPLASPRDKLKIRNLEAKRASAEARILQLEKDARVARVAISELAVEAAQERRDEVLAQLDELRREEREALELVADAAAQFLHAFNHHYRRSVDRYAPLLSRVRNDPGLAELEPVVRPVLEPVPRDAISAFDAFYLASAGNPDNRSGRLPQVLLELAIDCRHENGYVEALPGVEMKTSSWNAAAGNQPAANWPGET
jgi:hypothetical protein